MIESKMQKTRAARAMAVRDAVMPLLRLQGALKRHERGNVSTLDWLVGGWSISHRHPFSNWPSEEPKARNMQEAIILQRSPPVFAYGLDIWSPKESADAGLKVLNAEWDDKRFNLIGFRKGSWDDDLLSLLAQRLGLNR